ncbi:MAG: 1-deoxy-D-xylulose-5-phosphate reductoisomerase [Corallococcus sp.]|nr:1-deoxy-D-xylulose-5-phosphate reductoisomerase [Corallococcus sp.]
MKKVAILGSTGSIGRQTIDVVLANKHQYTISSLVAYSNEKLLAEQAKLVNPQYIALVVRDGVECLTEAVKECDIAVIATRGIIAIDAVMYCIGNNIDIALANKEVLVTCGEIVTSALKHSKSRLLPIDSEHSAIWQCLQDRDAATVDKLILTASGGALWNCDMAELSKATVDDALRHPNWSMGNKITIDSATMVNKSLEVIEAHWLFGFAPNDIEIAIHRQSVVHSMIRFADGSLLAQMANPDMRLPIQYALSYPNRANHSFGTPIDLFDVGALTFEKCDFNRFPCAQLGYEALKAGKFAATAFNAANDVCVEAFSNKRIKFTDFYTIISNIMNKSDCSERDLTVEAVKSFDMKVRSFTAEYLYGV